VTQSAGRNRLHGWLIDAPQHGIYLFRQKESPR
jgi:hypothetical protein